MSERTVSDIARSRSEVRRSFSDKLFFTGRILVKKSHEDALMPDPVDPDDVFQYMAPELSPLAKGVTKVTAALLKRERSTGLLNRVLAIHDMRESDAKAISVFEHGQKVEARP
jgi:hypothetical protein